MRIRYALADRAIRPDVLDAALEVSTRANRAALEAGERPITEAIRAGKVRWRPEPFTDGEHFDDSATVQRRGWGDCDDLAPALAAELRATGRDPRAKAVVRRSGPSRWHAVVRMSDGQILDPSKWAGMGKRPQSIVGCGVQGAICGEDDGVIGIKRAPDGRYAVRCDLPLDGTGLHVCGQALSRRLDNAIVGAIDSALVIGDDSGLVDPDQLLRAAAWQAALTRDVAQSEELSGEDRVGFLPLLASMAPSVLKMASGLLPGGKKSAAPAGTPTTPGGPAGPISATPAGGGGSTTVTPYGPGGPIIVRF